MLLYWNRLKRHIHTLRMRPCKYHKNKMRRKNFEQESGIKTTRTTRKHLFTHRNAHTYAQSMHEISRVCDVSNVRYKCASICFIRLKLVDVIEWWESLCLKRQRKPESNSNASCSGLFCLCYRRCCHFYFSILYCCCSGFLRKFGWPMYFSWAYYHLYVMRTIGISA